MDEETIDWIREMRDNLQEYDRYDFTSEQREKLHQIISQLDATETFEEAFKDY